ncbi:LOW QUALITY PROTEIN: non-specific lipid transfer protein GPI-anchored 15-like [Rutidosis leptorrhynchoides]|uniref:LOW QUALITY PROTEIN: non-specific lipid transfer protein GPI-anchored 15-like n=1 Tax=Rutidosis leptorrhynchoides TaxID=125765 RepID=UPI003A9A449C
MSTRILILTVFVAMLCYGAVAQQTGCTSAITSLVPCLNYITGNSSTPSSSCCSNLSSVVQSTPQCLCSLLNGGGSSFGLNINQTQALALPGACNVKTPQVSQCNGGSGPATSPAVSPSTDGSDDTPDAGISPSASVVPSGTGGSKTVPSTDSGSSAGSSIEVPLKFLVFVGLCVATITKL